MLYWIIMDIVDMPDKITVISDLVFPETLLPDSYCVGFRVALPDLPNLRSLQPA